MNKIKIIILLLIFLGIINAITVKIGHTTQEKDYTLNIIALNPTSVLITINGKQELLTQGLNNLISNNKIQIILEKITSDSIELNIIKEKTREEQIKETLAQATSQVFNVKPEKITVIKTSIGYAAIYYEKKKTTKQTIINYCLALYQKTNGQLAISKAWCKT